MFEAKVIDLQIQPLKGGGPLRLSEARMTKAGLETVEGKVKDHFLVVVSEETDTQGFHNFLTQRVQVDPKNSLFVSGTPRLALVRPQYENGRFSFKFDGRDEVEDLGEENDDLTRVIPVQLWEYRGGAVEVPTLSEWLSDNLQRRVKVARTSGPWDRMARQNFMENDNPLRAQDGYPIHAVNLEDVEAAFAKIKAPVDPNRFRYQILLQGLPVRAIHDYILGEINRVLVDQPKPCDRCEVTGIDQEKGVFSPIKPLAGIARLGVGRWIRPDNGQKKQIMGENLLPRGECIIRVGDSFKFIEERSDPLQFEKTL